MSRAITSVLITFPILAMNCENLWVDRLVVSIPSSFRGLVVIGNLSNIAVRVATDVMESVIISAANLEQVCHALESSALSQSNTLAITSAEELMKYESPEKILQLCVRHNFCSILSSRHASNKSSLNFARKMSSFLSLETNVYWIQNESDSLSYWESYSVKGGSVVRQVRGVDEEHLFSHLLASKYSRRRDFRGATITATATSDRFYDYEVQFSVHPNGSKYVENGLALQVYRVFRDRYNFSERSIEGLYMTSENPRGQDDRIHIQLHKGLADISISLSAVTEEKTTLAQFLHGSLGWWLEVRFAEPSSVLRFFAQPFQSTVWNFLLLFFAGITACRKLIRCILIRREIETQGKPEMEMLTTVSALCQQGWYPRPESQSLRSFLIVVIVSGYLVSLFYVGTLTSQLTVSIPTSFTLEGLLDMGYTFFIEEGVAFPVDLNTFEKWGRVTVIGVSGETSAVGSVANTSLDSSAFISFPEYFYSAVRFANYSDAEACSTFKGVRASKIPSVLSMAVNKTSALKEHFNVAILAISDHGVLRRLYRKHKRGCYLTCDHSLYSLTAQTLRELCLAYVLLSGGICLAIIALLLEKLWVNTARTPKRPSLDGFVLPIMVPLK